MFLHLSSSVCFYVSCFSEQTEPFLKPVSLEQHPDYAEYIFHPMDLSTLEKVIVFFFSWEVKRSSVDFKGKCAKFPFNILPIPSSTEY